MTYNEIKLDNGTLHGIEKIDDNGVISYIPLDPANSDYQRYLRWLNGEEENGTIS